LNKVQFDSMAFQEQNGTCGMKQERSGWNLAEKSGTDRDLKWDEICSVLFRFLNWYGMFRPFRAKRNEIDNLDWNKAILIDNFNANVIVRVASMFVNLKLDKFNEILFFFIKLLNMSSFHCTVYLHVNETHYEGTSPWHYSIALDKATSWVDNCASSASS